VGIEIAAILYRLYPKDFDPGKLIELVGNEETIRELQKQVAPDQIVTNWSDQLEQFDAVRRKYFLYK
jgi:uncharacterized protein YbbC (DUF1343 family)